MHTPRVPSPRSSIAERIQEPDTAVLKVADIARHQGQLMDLRRRREEPLGLMPRQTADGELAAQIPLRARKRETSDAVVPAGCRDPVPRTVCSVRTEE
jgi:hypothetical protein